MNTTNKNMWWDYLHKKVFPPFEVADYDAALTVIEKELRK